MQCLGPRVCQGMEQWTGHDELKRVDGKQERNKNDQRVGDKKKVKESKEEEDEDCRCGCGSRHGGACPGGELGLSVVRALLYDIQTRRHEP
jgi:hypothetical protein